MTMKRKKKENNKNDKKEMWIWDYFIGCVVFCSLVLLPWTIWCLAVLYIFVWLFGSFCCALNGRTEAVPCSMEQKGSIFRRAFVRKRYEDLMWLNNKICRMPKNRDLIHYLILLWKFVVWPVLLSLLCVSLSYFFLLLFIECLRLEYVDWLL